MSFPDFLLGDGLYKLGYVTNDLDWAIAHCQKALGLDGFLRIAPTSTCSPWTTTRRIQRSPPQARPQRRRCRAAGEVWSLGHVPRAGPRRESSPGRNAPS
ncbi:hypothetical protein [Pseudonocardia sp.]|uniref:hypothetical protein n=1 Tax=Pseudonocardia sp. TaxID=60912 RepID=UPI0031FCB953